MRREQTPISGVADFGHCLTYFGNVISAKQHTFEKSQLFHTAQQVEVDNFGDKDFGFQGRFQKGFESKENFLRKIFEAFGEFKTGKDFNSLASHAPEGRC